MRKMRKRSQPTRIQTISWTPKQRSLKNPPDPKPHLTTIKTLSTRPNNLSFPLHQPRSTPYSHPGTIKQPRPPYTRLNPDTPHTPKSNGDDPRKSAVIWTQQIYASLHQSPKWKSRIWQAFNSRRDSAQDMSTTPVHSLKAKMLRCQFGHPPQLAAKAELQAKGKPQNASRLPPASGPVDVGAAI